jgi:prophage tail gpP-like protein
MEYLLVNNQKSGKQYIIKVFKNYVIDQSINIPADHFSFQFANTNSAVSDAISAGDEIFFYIDDELVINGFIDDFEVEYNNTSDFVDINGRDKTSMLLDNDPEPNIYYNLTLKEYIEQAIQPYGFNNIEVDDTENFNKIHVHPGESEWSMLERLAQEKGLYPMYISDTFYCTKLKRDTSNIVYTFSNDLPEGIKYKSIKPKISSDIKSEIMIYGGHFSMSDYNYKNTQNIQAIAKDETLKIKKRKIINNDDIENNKNAENMAKSELVKANRNAFTIQLILQTKRKISVNTIAKIYDKKLGLDCLMLVDHVQYTKSIQGSLTNVTLRLIEGVQVDWKNHNIPLLPVID